MSVKEHDIPAVEFMREYFGKLRNTASQLHTQFTNFSTPEKVYVLTGNINTYKRNIKRIISLLDRINFDLINDGVCIIEPVKTTEHGNSRTSSTKQDSRPKRRKKIVE
jgi:hypothetical protein